MRLSILVPSIGDFGKKGYYNTQEIGLAKALDCYFEEILVYRMVPIGSEKVIEKIEGCKNSTMHFVPCKQIGSNGVVDTRILDASVDAMIFFSDIQMIVPQIWRWARKNNIYVFPYIGVVESHSTSYLARFVMDCLFRRNLRVYKKCTCFVKTPEVGQKLRDRGVKDVVVASIGLDVSLMRPKCKTDKLIELKKKYGYQPEEKVILFVGRLIDEKQPLRMVDIYSEIFSRDEKYRLIIVGNGNLKADICKLINEKNLTKQIKIIDKIPNSDIWELYCLSDAFVNLNQQEIFGMAILEAMYYECKVVAWKAPGPNFIIENNISGYLVDSNKAAVSSIMSDDDIGGAAHYRIMEKFTWTNIAKNIVEIMQRRINETDF